MADKKYTRTISFDLRVTLCPALLGVTCKSLADAQLKFRHASFAGEGVDHRVGTESELLALQDFELAGYNRLYVWYQDGQAQVVLAFRRIRSEQEKTSFNGCSDIEVESPDPTFIFKLLGLKSQLEHQFCDLGELSTDRFTARALGDMPSEITERIRAEQRASLTTNPAVVNAPVRESRPTAPEPVRSEPVVLDGASLSRPAQNSNKSKLPILSILIAAIALGAYYWQGHSNDRQATTAEKSYVSDEGALFKGEPTSSSLLADRPHSQPFAFRVTNVGKGAATNVGFRCGSKSDHGLEADLGTIPPLGGSSEIVSLLSLDNQDVLHRHDSECTYLHCLMYDDAVGHHVITFDNVGNAQLALPSEGW